MFETDSGTTLYAKYVDMHKIGETTKQRKIARSEWFWAICPKLLSLSKIILTSFMMNIPKMPCGCLSINDQKSGNIFDKIILTLLSEFNFTWLLCISIQLMWLSIELKPCEEWSCSNCAQANTKTRNSSNPFPLKI